MSGEKMSRGFFVGGIFRGEEGNFSRGMSGEECLGDCPGWVSGSAYKITSLATSIGYGLSHPG